jgi:hypothetical protein
MMSNKNLLLVHPPNLITAANQYVFLSQIGSNNPFQHLKRKTDSPSDVSSMKLASDGFLLVGYENGEIVVWNLKDSF